MKSVHGHHCRRWTKAGCQFRSKRRLSRPGRSSYCDKHTPRPRSTGFNFLDECPQVCQGCRSLIFHPFKASWRQPTIGSPQGKFHGYGQCVRQAIFFGQHPRCDNPVSMRVACRCHPISIALLISAPVAFRRLGSSTAPFARHVPRKSKVLAFQIRVDCSFQTDRPDHPQPFVKGIRKAWLCGQVAIILILQ